MRRYANQYQLIKIHTSDGQNCYLNLIDSKRNIVIGINQIGHTKDEKVVENYINSGDVKLVIDSIYKKMNLPHIQKNLLPTTEAVITYRFIAAYLT